MHSTQLPEQFDGGNDFYDDDDNDATDDDDSGDEDYDDANDDMMMMMMMITIIDSCILPSSLNKANHYRMPAAPVTMTMRMLQHRTW